MKSPSKRTLLKLGLFSTTAAFLGLAKGLTSSTAAKSTVPVKLTEQEWRKRLTKQQYYVLREEGTERAFSSQLNNEKRAGTYHCAGCDQALFTSEKKYDSGTGWPSFYDVLPGAIATKTDYYIGYPRTEYHCSRCGGHHGHVFKDGPKPTGLRYCNNGVALTFKPKS